MKMNELEQQHLLYEAPQMLTVTVMLQSVVLDASNPDTPGVDDGGEIPG